MKCEVDLLLCCKSLPSFSAGMSSKPISIVVAATASTQGIGRAGTLPWKIPSDMAYFKKVTSSTFSPETHENVVIMGRKTWESIPAKFRPLAGRRNIVLSRQPKESLNVAENVSVFDSLQQALDSLVVPHIPGGDNQAKFIDQVFVIGGASIYNEALQHPSMSRILLTSIETEVPDCDTFFPTISATNYKMSYRSDTQTENGFTFRFLEFEKIPTTTKIGTVPPSLLLGETKNFEECQYLDIIQDILDNGVERSDRTGTGTISKFGVQMRFNLRNETFPLLTTKRVFWRGVAEELLWFVKGTTNANELAAKNIHIWDGNGSREFLDNLGLSHREEGDLGPVYGFQWRHFGAPYVDMHTDYSGQGVDQLQECIQKIKTNPSDRRIVLTAWNPTDLGIMALPPCHMFCQFYVANGELSCQMYQRSADMGLGVPFNIASYALLTRLVAQSCGIKAGDFVHCIGDAHVYLNHVEALKEQLKRVPKSFPKLRINPEKTDIDSFEFSDFTIEGYKPDATIKMKMAV